MNYTYVANYLCKLLFAIFALACAITSQAQTEQTAATCPAGIPETANKDGFVVRPNGEVLHIASQLIFMQCSIGQTWDGTTCGNEPTPLNWQQALRLSVQTDFNGSKNWRLPNVKELNVITERACVRPSINDAIFPNTSPDDYWTSTPSMLDTQFAWALAFTNASNSQRLKTRSMFVRLVRTKLANE
ncbi:MAG: hypothetical protein ACJAVV_002396 [Alphaproteobacteria bacterium]|jgi:hypothetical protein